MKKQMIAVGLALIVGGCATVEYTDYPVTSFAEVGLKKGAKIKVVVGSKTDQAKEFISNLKKEFTASGQFQVVDQDADYWMVLSATHQYQKDKSQDCVVVKEQENKEGGQEILAFETRNFATAAHGVSIAIYEVKTLTPFYYLEIPLYDGENSAQAPRTEKSYDSAFVKKILGRIKDIFLTQEKTVQTPMPLKADSVLRSAFDNKDWELFNKRFEEVGVKEIDPFVTDILTGKYEGDDANTKLCNCYLYLLFQETKTKDVTGLKELKDKHLKILQATSDDGLSEAAPVALARIEYKLSNLGIK